jgi:hypothetical protein
MDRVYVVVDHVHELVYSSVRGLSSVHGRRTAAPRRAGAPVHHSAN